MKALSLLEPWASLMAVGAKNIETRSWRTDYRGPVFIHASKGKPPGFSAYRTYVHFERYWPETFHFGCIIAIGDLIECVPTGHVCARLLAEVAKGSRRASEELAFGNYYPGRWAWRFESIRQVNPAVPVRGSLGLWTVPDSVLSTINHQPSTH